MKTYNEAEQNVKPEEEEEEEIHYSWKQKSGQ